MKIAYIMSRFPHLPETFILREINELVNLGWQIALYPLILQSEKVVHPEAQQWLSEVNASPYLSGEVLLANLRMFLAKPLTYLKVLLKTIAGNLTDLNFFPRAVLLFPKAVYFAGKMQKEGIGHIHAHYASHPALVAWIIHELTGIPYSITAHAHDIFARTPMLSTKLRAAAFIIAISEYNREHMAYLVGPWVRSKTHVIHCGILPEKYIPANNLQSIHSHLDILSVGSLKPIKGQKYLVEACKILKEQAVPFHCRIIGSGPEYNSINALVTRYGLEDSVELLGAKNEEEVAELLPTANCFVQPSIGEGLPVAVMEALVTQLPVVATVYSGAKTTIPRQQAGYPVDPSEAGTLIQGLSRIYRDVPEAGEIARALAVRCISRAGLHELVIPGQTGYLVPPADPAALADALIKILHEPDQAVKMGQAGHAKVLEAFDLHKNVRAIAALFQKQENFDR